MSQDQVENGQDLAAVDPLTWQVQLYAKEPGKRIVVIVVALIAGWLGFLLLDNLIVALMGFFAILIATGEFWLPLNYKLDENRAAVRCGLSVTAIEWSDVKRIVTSEEGWNLSPLGEEGRLSPFRGVYLRFGMEPEAVRTFVRKSVQNDVRYVEHGAETGGGGADAPESGAGDPPPPNGDLGDPRSGDA